MRSFALIGTWHTKHHRDVTLLQAAFASLDMAVSPADVGLAYHAHCFSTTGRPWIALPLDDGLARDHALTVVRDALVSRFAITRYLLTTLDAQRHHTGLFART